MIFDIVDGTWDKKPVSEKAFYNEKEKAWQIEINSLEELLDVDYGDSFIVEPANQYHKNPIITINYGWVE